ncbi:MAG: cytoplasmic protein [Deltaproteobacteria bacterium]|nr:cytoplasmic protein [Deltaproteobacteria bacterium]
MKGETYRDFEATELFCPHCKKAVPVRKKLLLVLADGDKYDYTCVYCGTSVGDKMVRQQDNLRLIIK